MTARACPLSLIAFLAFAPASPAQGPAPEEARVQAGAGEAARAQDEALARQKERLARRIIAAREEAQRRGPFAGPVVQYWMARLAALPVEQLQSIAAQGPGANLVEAVAAAQGAVAAGAVSPDLGDSARDLVYTGVTPCRVVDTRVAGGPLASASQRNFYIAGTTGFASQGGVACGIPEGATSVAVNVTVTGTAGPGWLRAWPYLSSGTASIINYAAGDTIANGLILPICDPFAANCSVADLTVRADAAGTHVLIDVMGYFMRVDKADYRTFTVSALTQTSLDLSPAGQCKNYQQVQVVAPGAGEIVVSARFQLWLNHTQGTDDEVWAGIVTDGPTTCTSTKFEFGRGSWQLVHRNLPTAPYYPWDTIIYSFAAPSAGTYSFYFNGKKTTGSGAFQFGSMTATFHPQ